MTSTISALTTGGGGIVMSGDSSGNLSLLSGVNTVVAVTATGATVTGTLAVSGGVTLTTTLPVLQGGTGVTTKTGTTNVVLSNSPTLVSPSISSAVMTTMASSVLTSATSQATTSGTFKDFTGIPSWVKRITLSFAGVSTNGTSYKQIQLITGASTVVVTGYTSNGCRFNGTAAAENSGTTGFFTNFANIADLTWGNYCFTNPTGNTWVGSGGFSTGVYGAISSGGITLAAALTGIRLTTVNGTDVFDAGSVNILYE